MCCRKGCKHHFALYSVLIIESAVLGLALAVVLLAGPAYHTTERASQARKEILTNFHVSSDDGPSRTAQVPKTVTLVSGFFCLIQLVFLLLLAIGHYTRSVILLGVFLLWCILSNIFIISILILGEVHLRSLSAHTKTEEGLLGAKNESSSISSWNPLKKHRGIRERTKVPLLRFFHETLDEINWYLVALAAIKAGFGIYCVLVLISSVHSYRKRHSYGSVPT